MPAFSNSESNYKDANNFTLFINAEGLKKFKDANIADPAAHFNGKTVQVSGKVVLHRNRPEIVITGPEQIKIVEPEDAAEPIGPENVSKPIGPEEAARKVNQEVTLRMKVKSAMMRRGACLLNSEDNYKDSNNFTLLISSEGMEKFKDAEIADPAAHFKDKTVQASGKVVLDRTHFQIVITGPEQIKIVEAKNAEEEK